MEEDFKQLTETLSIAPVSVDVLRKLAKVIKQQTIETFPSFVTQWTPSLLLLKTWSWNQFSWDAHEWIGQPAYVDLFHAIGTFHNSFIGNCDHIESDVKASLLVPDSEEQVQGVLQSIKQSQDDNDSFLRLISRWLDNLSFFLRENPEQGVSPIFRLINQAMARDYLMTQQFKVYLAQLQETTLPRAIFTARQLFHVRTCVFSLSAYLISRAQDSNFTPETMLRHVGKEYVHIMQIHSQQIPSWPQELTSVITYLTSFVLACCWWGGDNSNQRDALLTSEETTCNLVQALIRIVSYEPLYDKLRSSEPSANSDLIYAGLKFILNIVQAQLINWLFRSNNTLPVTLFKIAEMSASNSTSLCAYAILGEILPDEKLKELTYAKHVGKFFYDILEQGWHHPTRKYKHMPVSFLLRSFVALSKSDAIQASIASSGNLSLLIAMSDEYPIAYDIIWGISFNQDIQQQLHSNTTYIEKLSRLANESDYGPVQKATSGILWNLGIQHQHQSADNPEASDEDDAFDIMISYSHKDKLLCKQLYDELTRRGYRVWIDFDQMRGNVMDAMAHAIDRSRTILICMSEQYRKSNFCRAEAHYAFQRQRHIVPVLVQKHYKADGWLLFLAGQLLYVDFTKHEFERAMEMLVKELEVEDSTEKETGDDPPATSFVALPAIVTLIPPKPTSPPTLPSDTIDWTQKQVQEWLLSHNLTQMSQLLIDLNGRSLLFFGDYVKSGGTDQILHLLREDCQRKTGQTLSLTELASFQSLWNDLVASSSSKPAKKTDKERSFICCSTM